MTGDETSSRVDQGQGQETVADEGALVLDGGTTGGRVLLEEGQETVDEVDGRDDSVDGHNLHTVVGTRSSCPLKKANCDREKGPTPVFLARDLSAMRLFKLN